MTAMEVQEEDANSRYKWCFVPMCLSTTVTTPEKVFVNVPRDNSRRRAWLKAARRDVTSQPLSLTSQLYCCQDHFNMEDDMDSYLRFKIMGGNLRSKNTVVPHIFVCQPQRNTTSKIQPRPRTAALKRNAIRLVSEAISNMQADLNTNDSVDVGSEDVPGEDGELEAAVSNADYIPENISTLTATVSCQTDPVHVTCKRPKFRSKGITCRPSDLIQNPSKHMQTSPLKTSPLKTHHGLQLTAVKIPPKRARLNVDDVFTDTSADESKTDATDTDIDDSSVNYTTDSDDPGSEEEFAESMLTENMQRQNLDTTRNNVLMNPMRHIGLPLDCDFVLDDIAENLDFKGTVLNAKDVVMLVLKKIRGNDSFDTLGEQFGISKSHACRLFNQFIESIAEQIMELIVWPVKETVNRTMPLSFQARYSNIQSIIDCFEIEIEKPSNAVSQALTWSDYKKCNTLKYLVSCTPDGIINFISAGYGGRVSDMVLLEDSGFLEKLAPNMDVMADRGFKHVDSLIKDRLCRLVRPPSVVTGSKLSEQECRDTKRIASLRIHVERLIRRIREFRLLIPHSCLDNNNLSIADSCVVIAAGLVNLQGSLTKQ